MRERIDGVAYMDEGPRGPPEGALEHPVSKSSNLVVPKRGLVANRRTVPGHQNPAAPRQGLPMNTSGRSVAESEPAWHSAVNSSFLD